MPARQDELASPTLRTPSGMSTHLHTNPPPPNPRTPSAGNSPTTAVTSPGANVWQEPNLTGHLVEGMIDRISKSVVSLKGVVEMARIHDPNAFIAAREKAEVEHPTSVGKNHFASETVQKLAQEFHLVNLAQGLTTEQVLELRQRYGENLLDKEQHDPIWKIFARQFMSFIILLLLVATVLCLVLAEWVEGVAIFIIVMLNASLATYMEKSAGDALSKLASMAAPQCRVLRNGGQEMAVDATEVVPGDVVMLGTGDNVAADMRVVMSVELKANEAILTGEPEDVKKTLEAVDRDEPFATNMCFASTSVTNGNGRGLVVATGMETQVGRIAEQLKRAGKGSRLTPLQRGLNKLGCLIGVLAICVLIIVVVVAIVTGYRDPAHPDKSQVLTIILVAVGFAVSSIPEGLPMVVTISLSLGARDMVKRRANVRKLPAVETLGCCSVICSDKTGTLTEGKMTAIKLVTVCRQSDEAQTTKTFAFYPTKGFDPNGGVFDDNDLDESTKDKIIQKFKGGEFQSYDAICKDYGNPSNEAGDASVQMVRSLLLSGYLNSYGTRLVIDKHTKQWATIGNMSEGAIVVAAGKGRFGTNVHPFDNSLAEYERLVECEVPFNSSRKMMATVHKLPRADVFGTLHFGDDHEQYTHVAIVKGAPDRVLTHVQYVTKQSSESLNEVDWSRPVTSREKEAVSAINLQLSQAALRVLAFTVRPLSNTDIDQLMSSDAADERLGFLLGTHGEKRLVMLGVMGSLDPARPGVAEAINTCRGAGVRVIMITGDQQPTACAIAKDIGLLSEDDDPDEVGIQCQCLHGNDDATEPHKNEAELDTIVSRVNVFSRAQPEDKITIVDALRRQGHVVAMTGDGVNDAPALKAADIGVAMGIVGTDVAKGAAEMVLLDDNFCTIVGAIEEGRKIYANIQKFVCFLLGTNIGEIIYLTVSIAASLPLPLEALQILFLNLMSDGCPAVALSREPADQDNMLKPPRPRNQPIMTREWWFYGNIPHTIFEAACVLASLCLSLYLSLGVLRLSDIENQCYKGAIQVSGSSSTKDFKYFCRSYEYRVSPTYTGWVTNIDYWDPKTKEMRQYLGVMPGKVEDISITTPELPFIISAAYSNGCGTGTKPMPTFGWCMPDGSTHLDEHDLKPIGAAPKDYQDVSARGSRLARTQSFITAVWCEMLRAYTVRSWEWVWDVFNRNPWMHFACSTSATLTTLVTIVPGITYVFSTATLAWWQYLLAISWAIVNLVLDELLPKPFFRHRRKVKKASKVSPESMPLKQLGSSEHFLSTDSN